MVLLCGQHVQNILYSICLCKVVPLLCDTEPLSQCPVLLRVIAVQLEGVKNLDTYLVTGALPLSAW